MNIEIKLPPYGTIAYNLVADALSLIAFHIRSTPRLSLSFNSTEYGMKISGEEASILDGLNYVREDAAKRLNFSLNKLGDFPAHKNDEKTFSKLGVKSVKRFGEGMLGVLNFNLFQKEDLNEFSQLFVASKKGCYEIFYGKGTLAMPQFLLIERIKASNEFMRGRGGKELKVKLSKPWMLLLAIGFALAYSGFVNRTIMLVHAPWEETVKPLLEEKNHMGLALLEASNGVIPKISELNVPSTPKNAFHLYATSKLILEFRKMQVDFLDLLVKKRLPLEFDRILWTGRAYTLLERFSIEFSSVAEKLSKLKDSTLEWIDKICRKLLLNITRNPTLVSPYLKLIQHLYNAILGSENVLEALYYANRVVLEGELEEVKRKRLSDKEARSIEEKIRSYYNFVTRDFLLNFGFEKL